MISSIIGATSSYKEGNGERLNTNGESTISVSQVVGQTTNNVNLLGPIDEEVDENVITFGCTAKIIKRECDNPKGTERTKIVTMGGVDRPSNCWVRGNNLYSLSLIGLLIGINLTN